MENKQKILKPILIGVVILVLTPFIVSALFKIKPICGLFQAEWGPDALLGYVGSIIGAIATIYAVILTIQFTVKQQRRDQIIAAKPWLTSGTELMCFHETVLKEENGATLFVARNGELFGISKVAPFAIKQGKHEINKVDCIIKYCLRNVGGNTATSLSVTLDGTPLFPDFALGTNMYKSFIFVLPLKKNEAESQYHILFTYGDVVSETKYIQEETLIIKKDANGVTFVQGKQDLLTTPKMKEIDPL